ncbi:MAG: tetratricopeptide repeat protein [Cyclobacteriaceae bacterium]
MAWCYTRKKDYQKAIDHYLIANTLIPKEEAYHHDRWEILKNLGRLCKIHGNYKQAEKYYKEGLQYMTDQDKPGMLYNLGNLYMSQENYDLANIEYKKGLDIAIIGNDIVRQVKFYNQIGLINKNLKQYKEARSYLKKALSYNSAGSSGVQKYQAKATHNIGNTYLHEGAYEQAIEWYLKALSLKTSEEEQFITLKDLGTCYAKTGMYKEADEYYQKAAAIYQQVAPVKENIELFQLMSNTYHDQNAHEMSYATSHRFFQEITAYINTKEDLIRDISAYNVQQQIDGYQQEQTFLEKLYTHKYMISTLLVVSLIIAIFAYRYYRMHISGKLMAKHIIKNTKVLS